VTKSWRRKYHASENDRNRNEGRKAEIKKKREHKYFNIWKKCLWVENETPETENATFLNIEEKPKSQR
jgi:hypothetical protein